MPSRTMPIRNDLSNKCAQNPLKKEEEEECIEALNVSKGMKKKRGNLAPFPH